MNLISQQFTQSRHVSLKTIDLNLMVVLEENDHRDLKKIPIPKSNPSEPLLYLVSSADWPNTYKANTF